MVLAADEDEVVVAREHVDDMGDDRLALDRDQRLGDGIAGAAETLAEARHRNHDLHAPQPASSASARR